MTAPVSGPRSPSPRQPRPDIRAWRWPDPTTPAGAVLYGFIGALILWLLITVLSHINVAVTWR